MKRYRAPKVNDNEIKMQRGTDEGHPDMMLYYGANIPRCDRALLMHWLYSDNINYRGGEKESLVQELEKRGYDLDTFKFSIEKKGLKNERVN